MSILTSTLIKSVVGTYSRWPLGETRYLLVPASEYGINVRRTETYDGKEYKFIGRLYAETLLRSDPFFADYFAYLDSISGSPVGNQSLAPFQGVNSVSRVQASAAYGTPFMRVK